MRMSCDNLFIENKTYLHLVFQCNVKNAALGNGYLMSFSPLDALSRAIEPNRLYVITQLRAKHCGALTVLLLTMALLSALVIPRVSLIVKA